METSAIDLKKAEIIAKAWSTPDYKRQLLANPKAVIAGEFDVDIPAGINIKVLEDTPDTAYLVLVDPALLPQTDNPNAYTGLIYKAWSDPAFKADLLADPQGAFGKYFQHQLPAKPALKVVEQTDSALYIVIPQRPASLSDAELDQVAGGISTQQKITYGVGGADIAAGVGLTAIGGAAFGAPMVIAGVGLLLSDDTVRHGIAQGAEAVGHGVATAAKAVGHTFKKIFHGW